MLDAPAGVGQNPRSARGWMLRVPRARSGGDVAMAQTASTIVALAAPSTESEPLLLRIFPLLLIFVVFYFIVFAPMRKKQKRHTEMLRELKAGDRVVTSGGIHGTVVGVTDSVVQLRIADQVKVDVSRSAVADRVSED